jgi:predicted nucleic acid-binding protein
MIVVSNTSPLTNIAAIGHFDLLRLLYQQIHIADAVWDELHADKQQWPGTLEVNQAAWIKRTSVHNHALVVALQRDLDRGEAETIALAIEQIIVGVLLEAKTQAHVQAVQPLLDRLRSEAGFFLSNEIYHLALELAQEAGP